MKKITKSLLLIALATITSSALPNSLPELIFERLDNNTPHDFCLLHICSQIAYNITPNSKGLVSSYPIHNATPPARIFSLDDFLKENKEENCKWSLSKREYDRTKETPLTLFKFFLTPANKKLSTHDGKHLVEVDTLVCGLVYGTRGLTDAVCHIKDVDQWKDQTKLYITLTISEDEAGSVHIDFSVRPALIE